MDLTLYIIAGFIILFSSLVGVAMTLLVMPGIWMMIVIALFIELWRSGTFSWWTIGVAIVLATIAEIIELVASGAGAARAGGARRSAILSILGGIVGAIVGTFALPIPVLGTIIGGVIGAGVAASLAERTAHQRTWSDARRVGVAAAQGRAISVILKLGFAVLVALLLTIAAFVP